MSGPGQLRRDEIIERNNSTCYLCGKVFDSSKLVIDHIIPTSRGERTRLSTWLPHAVRVIGGRAITCCQNSNG
ncbi:MAG: HNH endonuclease [Blastocatellia bacterium]